MRSQEEQKSVNISIRINQQQQQRIKENAAANKMTVSNYLGTVGANGGGITPKVMTSIQNILNEAMQEAAPQKKQKLQEEVNQL